MGLVMALYVGVKAAAVLIFTGVIAPVVGLGLKRLTGGWDSYGGGAFAILRDSAARKGAAPPSTDPAIQAAEVRQMLEAKAERRKVRGEPELDVEAESARLLAAAAEAAPAGHDEELRSEVRQLVVARNERRRRAGLAPLDVEAETERQLADLGG
ncbi:MAG TPA: hypothetical protein VHA80_04885 [Solirubrobacterales bacterium]|nr:hypothetical protein [Solirubrobacterales bacterium]